MLHQHFFRFIQWIGDSLAPQCQLFLPGARFCRFRAKKWPNSTFFGTNFENFFSYFFRNFDPTQGLYRWKHYALCVGWHGLAQKFAKRPNLPKMPKSQKGALTKKRYFYFWIFGLNMAGRYARSILNWNLRVFYRFCELCQFWRFYLKVQFWAIPLPEIKFWGHFQIMNFWSSLSKSALKSWFRPKKTPKNAYFGFFNGLFGAKNPKYAFFSSFYLPESTF